jgi:hypothetical protein
MTNAPSLQIRPAPLRPLAALIFGTPMKHAGIIVAIRPMTPQMLLLLSAIIRLVIRRRMLFHKIRLRPGPTVVFLLSFCGHRRRSFLLLLSVPGFAAAFRLGLVLAVSCFGGNLNPAVIRLLLRYFNTITVNRWSLGIVFSFMLILPFVGMVEIFGSVCFGSALLGQLTIGTGCFGIGIPRLRGRIKLQRLVSAVACEKVLGLLWA